MTYAVCSLTDEHHTALNKNFVNFPKLNRILRLEIFLHKDGQLQAVNVILSFTPISKHFQSPKHVIRAKDPRLVLIVVVVPDFLLTEPLPTGTQDAQLPTPLVIKLLYFQEPPIPSDDKV